MTDVPLPAPGDTSWTDWGEEQEELSDAAREIVSGRLTDAALRAAFGSLPSYVAAASAANKYDARTNFYNVKATNTRGLRRSIGLAQAGKGLAHHAFLGDSETDYYMGSDGSDPRLMWPRVYRSVLAGSGVPVGGSGVVFAAKAAPLNVDPRWTFTSGWEAQGPYRLSSANGDVATFTSTDPGTTVAICALRGSGPIGWSIDGGAATGTVDPIGTVTDPATYVLATGLADTTHTLTLTSTGATGSFYLISASTYRASGLLVHNLAWYGITAQAYADRSVWNNLNPIYTGALPATPDVVWLALGVNDINSGGRTPDQVAADLTTLRQQFPDSDCVLVAQYQPQGSTDSAWGAYVARLYALADTLDVPLLDLFDRSGGYTTADAAGLMGDVTHPNAAAQVDWGRAAARAL